MFKNTCPSMGVNTKNWAKWGGEGVKKKREDIMGKGKEKKTVKKNIFCYIWNGNTF